MNNFCNNRLFQFVLTLLVVIFSQEVFADGSKDLYPSTAQGGRAYLVSSKVSPNTASYPFPTLGTHYVYAKQGETIYVGSSAQNRGSGSGSSSSRGWIRLIAPNGQIYETDKNSASVGQIVDRTEELNGPDRAGVTNGYTPFTRSVTTAAQEGVWRVEFIPPVGENGSSVSAENSAATTWTQPTSGVLIAAWDVSISTTGSGTLIPGRVYTNVLNMSLNTSNVNENRSFFGTTYVLTKDGYVYRVKGNGFQGMYYTFFVNNKGFYAPNISGNAWTGADWSNATPTDLPSYKSFDYSNYDALITNGGRGPWLQDPRLADSPTGITHKMFYTIPANYANWNDLANEAEVLINTTNGAGNAVTTWLRPNATVIPEILNFTVVGVEGENQQASNKGAYIYFDANLAGTVRVRIEPDASQSSEPGYYNFAPKELIAVAEAGIGNPNNVVHWDGTDGNGDPLPPGILPTKITLRLQGGEVHFPYLDMEVNPNGLVIERLDPANFSTVLSSQVYWDDSKITISGTHGSEPHPTPVTIDILGSGENSTTNGHKWGAHGKTLGNGSDQVSYTGRGNANHGFGNERGIDTYAFILGDENTKEGSIRSVSVDLDVVSLSQDYTGTGDVEPGDTWNYHTRITNNGPSHALAEYQSDGITLIETSGSFFEFYLPPGVSPTDVDDIIVDVVNSAGGAREVPEFTRQYILDSATGRYKVKMMVDLPSGGILDITIPVVAGTTMVPGGDLVAWSTLLRPHDVTEKDATNLSTNSGVAIPPTNPFFECQGENPNPTTPVIFDPDDYESGDPIPCNNLKTDASLKAVFAPDMEFVKTVALTTDQNTNGQVDQGDVLTYTFVVKNTGNTTLTDVAITEKTFSGSGTHPVPTFVSATAGSTATTLLAGGEATFTATYTVTAADLVAGEISNQATVNADDPNGDPVGPVDSGNDPADPGKPGEPGDPTVIATLSTDLQVVKSVSNNQPKVGDVVTFSLNVENLGTADTDDVIIKDVVPTGYSVVTINNGGIQAGSEITWTVSSLANGDDITVSFTAIVLATGTHNNTATVSGENTDPQPLNNTSTVTVTPQANTRPDVNSGQVNTTIPGNVSTNDDIPTGTTYGTPAGPSNSPADSAPVLAVDTDGSYTFTTDKPGVYEYDVPVCILTAVSPCPTEKLTITVTDPALGNNLPVALDDYSVTAFNTAIQYPVKSNDGPGNTGGTLSAPTLVNAGSGGTFTVVGDELRYEPTSGFTGEASVTYQVCETPGTGCATAVWRITVQPVGALNTTSASDDYVHTVGTASVSGNVKTNDHDPEGHDQTVNTTSVTLPISTGTFIWSSTSNGEFTFTAAPGFEGTVDIPYTTCDNGVPSACANATLHIVVEAPVRITRPDVNSGQVNTTIPGDVSTNDNVPAGTTYGTDPSNPSVIVPTAYPMGSTSTLTINPDGTYDFTTNTPGVYEYDVPVNVPGYPATTEKLTITVTDPALGNNLPVALDDYSVTAFNTAIQYPVKSNDGPGNTGGTLGAPTFVGGATAPVSTAEGTFTVVGNELRYEPTPGFTGEASITYQVCETPGNLCATAVWRITVQLDNAPNTTSASDDYFHTVGTAPVGGNVKDNDRDPEGDDQTVQNTGTVNLPEGTLVWSSTNNGDFTFTAVPGFVGTVDIPYTTCDNGVPSACANATLHIVVEAPVRITRPDVNSGQVNTTIPGDVSTNDNVPAGTTYGTDPSNPSVIVPANSPAGSTSTLTINPDGTYGFTTNTPGVYEYDVPVNVPGYPPTTEKLTITVTDPALGNNPPVALDDYSVTAYNTPITYPVLSNDGPGNTGGTLGAPTFAGGATAPVTTAEGTFTIVGNELRYEPATDFTGEASVTYQVCETPGNLCATAVWRITVQLDNAPNTTSASDDYFHTVGTAPVGGNVKDNDRDPEGDDQTVQNTGTVNLSEGTLVWSSTNNGDFTFTAAPGFEGTVDIPYTTCDNGVPSACANATLHIVVEAPVRITRPDVNSGLVNTPIPGNVGTNDDIPAGTTYGTPAVPVGNPNTTIPTVNSDGSYTFTTNTPGIYEFDVPVNVPGYPQTTEKLIITVTDPALSNNPPILVNDNSVTLINAAVTNNVLANDRPGNSGGVLGTPSITTGPAHGTVAVNPDNTLTYTPGPDYVGTDRVEYSVCESPSGECATAFWDITVQPLGALNTTFAADDYVYTTGVIPVGGNILSNDTDLENDDQTVTGFTVMPNPLTEGTLTWSPDGTFSFTAVAGFTGTLDLPYTIVDSGSPVATAQATLHIVVEAPVVATRPDVNSGLVNTVIPGDVSTNDNVPVGTQYGTPVGAITNPNNSTPDINNDGTYTFTTDTPGVYEFEVPVCAPGAAIACPTEKLVITVINQNLNNNPPVLVNDNSVTPYNTAVTNNVRSNDNPGNTGGTLGMPSITTGPAHGTVVVNPDGTLTYTPAPGYVGTDQVIYRVCENPGGQCATAIWEITVQPVGALNTTMASDDYAHTVGIVPVSGNVKTNDQDPESNVQTVQNSGTQLFPGEGELVWDAVNNGEFTFTAEPGFVGTLDIPYTTCDNGSPSACASATLHIVVEAPQPDLEFVKTAALTDNLGGTVGKADAGETITYTFTVTNTGNVTLTNVVVNDPLIGLSTVTPTSVATLAPAATAAFTATYTVTQADVDAGKIDNQATVTVDNPDGGPLGPVESGNDPSDPGKPGQPGDPTTVDAIDPVPNLEFVKTAALTDNLGGTAGKADVGELITYTFTVTNTGNVTLTDVAITDPLPNLSTLTYSTWPGATGVLAPNQSVNATATYVVTQADVDAGEVENQATVQVTTPPAAPDLPTTPSGEDPLDPGKPGEPGEPTVVDAIDPQPNLTFVKTADKTTDIVLGETITYTFTVTNTGNVTLSDVAIADPLPNLSTLTYGTWPSGTTGVLAPTQSVSATATYVVVASDVTTGTVENQATVDVTTPPGAPDVPTVPSGDPTDPGTPTNPGDPTVVEMKKVADLSIVKTDNSTTYTPGVPVTYTITVTNNGLSNVTGATVTDNLPANLPIGTSTWTAAFTGGATGTPAGINNINESVDIPSGGIIVYTMVVNVPSDYTGDPLSNGELINMATVGVPLDVEDPNPGNNTSTDTNILDPKANLSVVKTDNAATYTPGVPVIYTVTVTNNGPSDLVNAKVEDTLPAGTTGNWTAAFTGGATGAAVGAGDIDETVDIPNGGSIVYTVTVDVPSDYTGNLVNTATANVPAGTTDPDPDDNTSTDTNTPKPVADLSVLKTNGATTYTPGTTVTYTVTVTNNGPSDVLDAVVTDNLPAGTTGSWTAALNGGATGNVSGTGHINESVNIPDGGSIVYTVTVNVPSSYTGNLVNSARVTPPVGTDDPTPGNDISTDTDVPNPVADLSVVKDNGSATYIPGTTVTYTVTVTNNGPSNVVGATVTDNLPAGTTGSWSAAFIGGASGAVSGTGSISELVNIPNGGSIVYTVRVDVPSDYVVTHGNLINTATVATPSGTTDPTPGNDSSTDTDTPAPVADLSIVKTDNSANYIPGTTVEYTITVSNNGPSDVGAATVTDNLPAGTTGSWSAVLNGGALGNTAGTGSISESVNIPDGGSIVYTVRVDVLSDYAITNGNLVNTATVSLPPAAPGVPTDPTPGNNTSTDNNPPAPVADLAITKTDNAADYIPGTTVTYTVTVTNNGPSDVVGARVEDQLPAGTTGNWTAVFNGGATGNASGTSHVDQNVNLPNGGSIVYTVHVHVPSDYTGDLVNAARVTPPAGTDDPTPGNNMSTDENPSAPVADLSVVKTDGSTTYIPGTTVTYTVMVANNGPSNVVGATVTDVLPAGTTGNWTAVMNGGATGALMGTGSINQTVNIPNGSSIVYTVHVNVPSDYTVNLVNTAAATVPAGTDDPTPGNDSSTDTDTPARVADLSVVKTNGSTTYIPGTTVEYTVIVSNNGPSDVVGATVTDNLPTGTTGDWTAVFNNGATGIGSGAGNIGQMVNMPNGSSVVYTVKVNVPSNYTGNLINTATAAVPAGTTDPTPGNDSSTDEDTLAPVADLSVVKTDGSATYTPGTPVTYTVTVTNNGPSDVIGARVEDHLPAGTTGSWTAVFNGGAAGNTLGTGHINENVNIPDGGSIVYTVTVDVPSDYTGDLVNSARAIVPSGTIDPTPGNDISTDTNTPDLVADLAVVKDNGSTTYIPGTKVTYTVTVTNNGPSDVIGATVTDNLPAGTTGNWSATFVGGASGTVSGTGNISQTVSIPNGGSIVYTVHVNVPSDYALTNGDLINTANATVPAGTDDPTPGNDSSTDTDTPASVADLSVVKTDNSATYTPGTTVEYIITVTNNGPSDVVGARVEDTMPVNTTNGAWTAAFTGGATGAAVGAGDIDETVSIPNGGSIVYTVTVDVPSDYTGNLVNTATATVPAGTTDPDPDDNTSTDTNTLDPVADLSITKTVNNATPQIDDVVTFTLTVSNAGPSDAVNVVVTDQLPNGYTLVGSTPSAGVYNAGVWTIPTLINGATATLAIEARVRSTGDYRNIATVTSLARDPNMDNNTDEAKPSVIDAFDDHFGSFNGHDGGTTIGSVLDNDLLNGARALVSEVELKLTPGQLAPAPAAGSITMDFSNGRITIAPGTTAGTYIYPYSICEVANPTNCDAAEATIIVTAAPIVATDNTYGPVNGAVGEPNVGNVLDNDRFNGGSVVLTEVELKVTQVALPIDPINNPNTTVPYLDESTGTVVVPAGTPDGTYTITYRICELLNITNCDDAEIRVTVGLSNIDALDDNYLSTPINGKVGGTTTESVIANDVLNGVLLTIESIIPTNPGDPALVTLTPGTSSQTGITMNADGTITVAANTPAGNYTHTYRICEVLNPANCDDALAVIVVTAPPIVAVTDDYTTDTDNNINGKTGGSTTVSVLANDLLNGDLLNGVEANPALVKLTSGTAPHPGISMDPITGIITVAANTPASVYTYPYTICEVLNPTNCANTTAVIRVTAAVINAVDDNTSSNPLGSINGYTGGKTTANVFTNDLLNGLPVVPAEVYLTPLVSSDSRITMNGDGTVSVAAGTPAGSYTHTYRICEILNPTNCDVATATVIVTDADIVANDDDYTAMPVNGATGNANVGNALTNDKLHNVLATLDKVTIENVVAATPKPGAVNTNVPVLNPATGIVSVPAGTPAGTYEIKYDICEILNPTNCDTDATITVNVVAAPIVANPNHYGPVTTVDGHPNLGNALENDRLNGLPVTLDKVNLTVTPATPLDPANTNTLVPIMNSTTGQISVPSGTPAGTYTIPYEICEALNPVANCANTTVTVIVSRSPIHAVNDNYGPVVGIDPHNFGSALSNDSFNGKNAATALTNGQVDIKVLTPAAQQPGAPVAYAANVPVLNTTTGIVTSPANTPAGRYDIQYEICEVADPTTCDQAWITVWITAANIDPDDDFYSNISSVSGTLDAGNVLGNDKLNFVGATITNVSIEEISAAASINGSPNVPLLDEATGQISVPAGTRAGEYRIRYRICELLNPTNCDHATVYINVALPQIAAVDNTYDPVNSTDGNSNLGNVLTNDTYNGATATLSGVSLRVVDPAKSVAGASNTLVPLLDEATGQVSVLPTTPVGNYTIQYEICDLINPTNCSRAVVKVEVFGAEVVAEDDDFGPVIGRVGNPSVGNVLANDRFNSVTSGSATTGNVRITVTAPATPHHEAVNTTVPVLNPVTGVVSVPAGTPAATYQIHYRICDLINLSNCDDAIVTINVTAATIDAVNDDYSSQSINGYVGGSLTIPTVLANDLLNGAAVVPSEVIFTPGATPHINIVMSSTGTITVAAGTPEGTYKYPYRICEVLNPANCDDAVATIVVTKPVIVANPDTPPSINGKSGGKTPSVFNNDTLNGDPVDENEVKLLPGLTPHPGLTMNPDGTVTVMPNTPENTYIYPYTICEVLNPTNCSSSTITVTVIRATIEAIDDDYTSRPINGYTGGVTDASVLTNDLLNLVAVTTGDVVFTPLVSNNPAVTMDAHGIITVAPGTAEGIYTHTYRICEVLNLTNCDEATATIRVAPAPIHAVDDIIYVQNTRHGATSIETVLTNDRLNGAPLLNGEFTLTPGLPSSPDLTMNPDGTINVAPGTKPGEYQYPYTICEVLNPTNCDDAVAVIIVEAPELFIPNIFTPNGDQYNPYFEIVGYEAFDSIDLTIINRWGNEVYRNENYNNRWDGQGLTEGTYFYIVKATRAGKSQVHKGYVTIKRN